MKTIPSSISIASTDTGQLMLQKMLIAFLIMAVLFALLPAAHVSAASANVDSKKALQGEWRDKINNVDAESFFYDRVRVYPADFKDLDELSKAHELLNNYGAALRTAGTLILNHAGFDSQGQVLNETQANQTIKAVAENLRIMRTLRNQLDGLEGDYRLLPRQS
jgi:hypothetical protein